MSNVLEFTGAFCKLQGTALQNAMIRGEGMYHDPAEIIEIPTLLMRCWSMRERLAEQGITVTLRFCMHTIMRQEQRK